ncbi:ThiF family adenylyltransferase [Flocculibacter collagenilyticus]|uniref:ThiF family adenylyltransferase n=1 Tax=Flocculibacter collagenilyticus TaxID=2744479 RepID=UPI0018F749F5|nr:ThiF family adenylyltransferase [Flocculibacter collagenilyticus]
MTNSAFDYDKAFSRNIGWFTEQEQHIFRGKKVAIAGCGGVGGIHVTTLARMGIGAFHVSDFDSFEVENFNRQIGATMSTIGHNKLDTICNMAKDINPEMELKQFPKGISKENVEEFLDGVDIYVDSLDFFAIEPRIAVFELCRKKGIPAITAAPLGMGTAFLAFTPDSMSFEEYFGMNGKSEMEKFLRFYLGLAPARLHTNYLVDPTRLNLKEKKGPSTIVGCDLCAGMAAAYVAKILLNRGTLVKAPWGMQFDAYENKLKKTWLPLGHKNPLFRLQVYLGKRHFGLD